MLIKEWDDTIYECSAYKSMKDIKDLGYTARIYYAEFDDLSDVDSWSYNMTRKGYIVEVYNSNTTDEYYCANPKYIQDLIPKFKPYRVNQSMDIEKINQSELVYFDDSLRFLNCE